MNQESSGFTGEQVYKIAQRTFGITSPTPAHLKYVLTQLVPSAYLLAHHSVHGHPITFSIPHRDQSKAQSHRPLNLLGAYIG